MKRPTPSRADMARRGFLFGLSAAALGFFGLACRTVALPPVDLSAPGWRVQQGQAVWIAAKGKPELAGELLLATHTNGDFLVQFAKTPFSLATARQTGRAWQIEFGKGEVRIRGRRNLSHRFAWLELPRVLACGKAAAPWQLERIGGNAWRLQNTRTGETVEGYLEP